MEGLWLRVEDLSSDMRNTVVRDGKGRNECIAILPATLVGPLTRHLERVRLLYAADRAAGVGRQLPRNLRHQRRRGSGRRRRVEDHDSVASEFLRGYCSGHPRLRRVDLDPELKVHSVYDCDTGRELLICPDAGTFERLRAVLHREAGLGVVVNFPPAPVRSVSLELAENVDPAPVGLGQKFGAWGCVALMVLAGGLFVAGLFALTDWVRR